MKREKEKEKRKAKLQKKKEAAKATAEAGEPADATIKPPVGDAAIVETQETTRAARNKSQRRSEKPVAEILDEQNAVTQTEKA